MTHVKALSLSERMLGHDTGEACPCERREVMAEFIVAALGGLWALIAVATMTGCWKGRNE